MVFSGRQEEPACQLLRQRRAALLAPLAYHVAPHRFGRAHKIHAAVLEEAPVFNRQHRLHHHRRNVVVLDQFALRALLGVEQRRHQLRLQFIRRKIVAIAA